jgi:hypothetical protein
MSLTSPSARLRSVQAAMMWADRTLSLSGGKIIPITDDDGRWTTDDRRPTTDD